LVTLESLLSLKINKYIKSKLSGLRTVTKEGKKKQLPTKQNKNIPYGI